MTEVTRTFGPADIAQKHCPECGSADIRLHATAAVLVSANGSTWVSDRNSIRSEYGRVECLACGHELELSQGDTLLDESEGKDLYAEYWQTDEEAAA
jgi:hypothetical protein